MKKKERIQRKNKYVFADSSAFFALFHRDDIDHKEAERIYAKLKKGKYILITTNLIVAETHQLIIIRLKNARKARDWLKSFYTNFEINILTSNEDIEKKARDIIYTYSDKDFSLADAVSFVVMDDVLQTQIAFAFDHHFEQKSFCLAEVELL